MKSTCRYLLLILLFSIMYYASSCCNHKSKESFSDNREGETIDSIPTHENQIRIIDTIDYNKRVLALANKDTSKNWPVEAPYPLLGAILPYNRIVAYYGNLYSKRMGILGEIPKEEMLQKLNSEVVQWKAADTTTNVIPALHYIAITAQREAGNEKLYRIRMPFSQIDTIINWAKSINALVFLDIQVGHSTIKEEVATLEAYLKLPHVHLGIDPEFAMKNNEIPGKVRGSVSSVDINDAIQFLAKLVQQHDLPPKILVVHRYTRDMVTDYQNIGLVPQVQVVMNMDGFGSQSLKKSSYVDYIYQEPVQFTGFKIFYKNDIRNNCNMCTPEEILELTPKPIYIQYQ